MDVVFDLNVPYIEEHHEFDLNLEYVDEHCYIEDVERNDELAIVSDKQSTQSDLINRGIDRGVLGNFKYNGFTHSIRLNGDLSFEKLKYLICSKWSDINPSYVDIFVIRGDKEFIISSDDDILAVVVQAAIKCICIVDLVVKRSSDAIIESDCSSSSGPSTGEVVDIGNNQNNGLSLWENAISGVGQTFVGSADFKLALRRYTIYHGRDFKFKKNRASTVSAICGRKDETGCEWKVVATKKHALSTTFVIKKMVKEHTCGAGITQLHNNQMTKDVVRSVIGQLVRDRPQVKPSEIIDQFRRENGVILNYYFAYAGKELALKEMHGDDESSYQELRWYVEDLHRTNPGSFVNLDVDSGTHRFKKVFICFEACIHGFKFCRPLIALDGCHLKAKYQGCMLSATATNGDGGMFPLAMSVVDAENNDNWYWFLENLRRLVGVGRELTFITDRHTGLISNIPIIFPNSHHAYCLWHLKNNFGKCLPAKFRQRKAALDLFSECARALSVEEHTKKYDELVDLGLKNCVDNFFDSAPTEHWVNAFFPGRKYGVMCSNMAESFNSWISEERNLPITSMLDHIRVKIMKQLSDRREKSRGWKTPLCPSVEKRLEIMVKESSKWKVQKSASNIFEVFEEKSYRVNISTRECGCNAWRIEGFPCLHAVVSILSDRKSVYEYCDPCFFASSYHSSYSHPVYPIPTNKRPIEEEIPDDLLILPPDTKRGPGRPKKNRFESSGVVTGRKRKRKCGRCKQYAYHNKKTCKAVIRS